MSRPPEANSDDAGSEFSLEVTPLSPPRHDAAPRSRSFHLPHSPRWKRIKRAAPAGCAILLALAVIFSGFLPLRDLVTGWALPQATATNTTEPTPALLGKVPSYCPPGNGLGTFSPAFSQGVGLASLHVWLVGFDGPTATARFTGGATFTRHGWPYNLMLVAAPDVTQPITLRAKGIFGVTDPVWFSAEGVENAVAALTFDPGTTPASANGWRSWLFYLLLPSAGCYYLDVGYGGHQTSGTFFAAGV